MENENELEISREKLQFTGIRSQVWGEREKRHRLCYNLQLTLELEGRRDAGACFRDTLSCMSDYKSPRTRDKDTIVITLVTSTTSFP